MAPFLRSAVSPATPGAVPVSQPGDVLEQDAERIANQATRLPQPVQLPSAPGDDGPGPDHREGTPLSAAMRHRIEPVLHASLEHVRVHTGPMAVAAAGSLRAKAFTFRSHIWLGSNQSPDDVELMAHEAAHAVQQEGGPDIVQRQVDGAAPGDADRAQRDPRGQTFAFSEEEMEARLAATPPHGADTSAPEVEVGGGTQATLNKVEGGAGDGAREPRDGEAGRRRDADGERRGRGAAGGERSDRGRPAARGERRPRRARVERPEGREPVLDTPGPAGLLEGAIGELVTAYLEGNLSEEVANRLDPRTQQLLEAADTLGDRSITDPETAALQGLSGEPLQPGASRTGYETESTFLRVIASIRDVTGQLGGIVGLIGLAATVAGFILSLLVPPVGAFLLTVGRFCDVAAVILDAVSLVLGVLLTGYNLYRLKNATDPEERRRLLGMVRQDAMGVVMSGIAVATAVAPGAARLLGRTRAGRLAGRAVRTTGQRVAGAAARLASQPTRLGRAAATVGRAGAAGIGGLRRLGGRVSGRFHTFMGRWRDYGFRSALSTTMGGRAVRRFGQTAAGRGIARGLGGLAGAGRRLASTAPARLAGEVAGGVFGAARRGAQRLSQSRAGQWVAGSWLGRRAQRIYGENLDMARTLFARSERAHHLHVGEQLKEGLEAAQRGTTLGSAQAARAALQQRFPRANFPEVDVVNLDFRRAPATAGPAPPATGAVGAAPAAQPQPFVFTRNETRLQGRLDRMRELEARAVRTAVAQNPGLSRQQIADLLNTRPNAPARWTADEVESFVQINPVRVGKTPHHTISVLDAPHLQYDPRYIQMANAPNVPSYQPFQFGAARRPPAGSTTPRDVPHVSSTGAAEDFGAGTARFGNNVPLTPPPGQTRWPQDYFRSEEFFEQLRLQGNTGLWTNPHNPAQTLLFDAHLVAGHRWVTGEAGARAIFGPLVDFAGRFEGTATRTLAHRAATAYARSRGEPAAIEEAFVDALAGEDGTELPDTRIGVAGMPLFMLGAAGGAGTSPSAEPEAPPSPVLYSPSSLESLREQRLVVGEAIGLVRDYIFQTRRAEEDNRAARDAAEALEERTAEQRDFARTERETVAGEQEKLARSGTARQQMTAENARASRESERGQSEANAVQAEGQSVSVEAKPEEPKSRSWLERAWDATVGALWDNLIAPAIRLVKRKVKQVMKSINDFIMKMINQALGLDEIEAELNAGGQDIQTRGASLAGTDAGLQETQEQAAQEAQRNQQTIERADANVAESRGTREEAGALLADLEAHQEALRSEEETGQSYIVDFGPRYRPFFEQQRRETETAASGSPSGALALDEEPLSLPPVTEPLPEAENVNEASAV